MIPMKIARMLVAAALLAPLCRADDSLALANKFLDESGISGSLQQSFEAGIKPSLDRMRAQGMPADLVESIHAASKKFFSDNFKWEELKPQVAKIYAENFTEAELRDIVAFYESPTGVKVASRMPTLMQQASTLSMASIQAKMPEFQQQIGALIQDYQKKAAADAAAKAPPSAVAAPTQTPQ